MSTSGSKPSRRETVGGRGGNHFQAIFIGSVVAVVLSFVVLLTVAADAFSGDDKPGAGIEATSTATQDASTAAAATGTTGTAPTSTAQPTIVDGKIVVACGDILVPLDKEHRLTSDCAPNDLVTVPGGTLMRSEAAGALREMFAAAKQEKGYDLYVNSGYRSYQTQVDTYNFWVQQSGQAQADRSSARPGHSEHQLGTTADIGSGGLELENFSGTPEAAWVAADGWKYGFIVSYPDGKEHITGYKSEPWHVRYVGKDVAQKVKDSGLTLHEYLLR